MRRGQPASRHSLPLWSADRPRWRTCSIRSGGDINARTSQGVTPLMAAVNSHPEAIPLLLAQGAGINAADQSGLTALHAAAAMGRTEVVRTLVESGADAAQLTASGLTALSIAEAGGHAEIADFLRTAAASSP